ncbi:sigma factor [Kribbella sp. NPDC050124]|uniref:sigma factor n=1 Tax=Kribbella sp. NPDC050124 TaxID=3364114 RepID=UPI0037AA112F
MTAEDLTSERFLRAFRAIARRPRDTLNLAAWLITIARNVVIDQPPLGMEPSRGRHRRDRTADRRVGRPGASRTHGAHQHRAAKCSG